MSSTLDYATLSQQQPVHWTQRRWCGLTGAVWVQIGTITALMAALFWPNLSRLWRKTNPISGEANWQHAMAVPLVGLYYLYLNRETLLAGAARSAPFLRRALGVWLQLQVCLWGLIFFVQAYYPTAFDSMFTRVGLLGTATVIGAATLVAIWLIHASARKRLSRGSTPGMRVINVVADRSSNWFGAYILLWGIVFYSFGIWPGRNDFFKDCGMVVTLFGAVLLMCGWRTMRIAWFPIAFLVVAIPWPGLMYSRIAMPLQEVAASAAVVTLKVSGVEAERKGTKLEIGEGDRKQYLNVAEACAGLKSLMTFVFLGGAVAFLSTRAMWQKLLISASAVPIAIFCNMLRVSGQGILHHHVSEKWSESFAHQFVGMVMLLPAFFLILGVGWILDNLFIEEADKRALRGGRAEKKLEEQVITIPAPVPQAAAKQAPARRAPAAAPEPTGGAATADLAAAASRLAELQRRRPTRGGRPAQSDAPDRNPDQRRSP